jgi:hypothetical protein
MGRMNVIVIVGVNAQKYEKRVAFRQQTVKTLFETNKS